MEQIRIFETPSLRNGVLITAFSGWNDASGVATWAVRFLIEQWAAVKCAEIEPEDYYVFTETRPQIRMAEGMQRRIAWPGNDFFYYRSPDLDRDFLLLLGVEPQLRWKNFVEATLGYAKQCGVTTMVTLGGLMGEVSHTLPAKLVGSATDPRLSRQLRLLRVELTRYEGPTGILGVMQAASRELGIAAASLWGNVPHYVSATPNPKVTLALLDRLNRLLSLGMDFNEVEQLVPAFDKQIDEAVAQNPQVEAYVRQLEERDRKPEDEAPSSLSDLPSGEAIVQELEDFLRRRRRDNEES